MGQIFFFLSPLECSVWIRGWICPLTPKSQPGCKHFVWRKQHSDTLEKSAVSLRRDVFVANEDTVNMHVSTKINSKADNLCKQNSHMRFNSRQDKGPGSTFTPLSSSSVLQWQGSVEQLCEGQERGMLSIWKKKGGGVQQAIQESITFILEWLHLIYSCPK